jgi:FixJ family two-component response regulator
VKPTLSALLNDDVVPSHIRPDGTSMLPFETIVYVASNDPERAKRLRHFLLSQRIGAVSFGLTAGFMAADYVATARDERAACLIIDLDFPDLTGLETQRVLAGSGAPPIIFVTERGDATSGVRAMKDGAVDFMIEPLDYCQLTAAIELAFAIDRRNRNERFERMALLACWRSLTPREAEVFRYTTAGFLNKQGAAELGIAENTYQIHRGRVMRKMKANSLADLVRMSTKLEPIFPEKRHGGAAAQLRYSIPQKRSTMGSSDATLPQ